MFNSAGGDSTATLPGDLHGNVLREQVRLAIGQISAMQGTSLLVAMVLAVVYWNFIPHPRVLAWVLMIAAESPHHGITCMSGFMPRRRNISTGLPGNGGMWSVR